MASKYMMYSLQCHPKTDADIIEFLERQKKRKTTSMNEVMKEAIRAHIGGRDAGK